MDSKMGDREKHFDTKSFRNQPKFFENEDMNGKAFYFISSLVEH